MKRIFLTISLLLSACVLQRSVVQQPELDLLLLDQVQQPLSNVKVVLYWYSEPHSRLRDSQTFVTNALGQIKLAEILQTDTAFPLMMHGVQEFHHAMCIEALGYQTVLLSLVVLPKDALSIRAVLHEGQSIAVCSDFERLYNHPGNARPDISMQHPGIRAAYELTSY